MRRHARLAAAVAIQVAILVAVPARQVRARLSGTPVTLRTGPVDPYSILSGYHVTLSYEVERAPLEREGFRDREEVWVTVRHGEPAWTLVSVTREKPAPASGQASLRARWRGGRGWAEIEGAKKFYIPEARRAAVDEDMRRVGGRALVDLRVHEDGTAAIVAVRFGDAVLRD